MRLGEERLAALIGVSRTPIREAMMRLHAEGLVRRATDGGMRLIPAFSVTENIALALDLHGLRLDRRQLRRDIVEASARYGLTVHPDAIVRRLSIGERQRVEILKVLMAGARLVILDEPTSVLAPQEVDALFAAIDDLRSQGFSVVIITHKLNEARAIADRVTVLRGGKLIVGGVEPASLTDAELVAAMVGRTVAPLAAERVPPREGEAPALELRGISVKGHGNSMKLTDIELTVGAGELVGIAGVSGNGQRELYEVALGLVAPSAGSVAIHGHMLGRNAVIEAIELGAVGVPEDPISDAVVPGLVVAEHVALADLPAFRKGRGIDWRRVRTRLTELDEHTQLRVAAAHRTMATLSGGNIQRVMRQPGRRLPQHVGEPHHRQLPDRHPRQELAAHLRRSRGHRACSRRPGER